MTVGRHAFVLGREDGLPPNVTTLKRSIQQCGGQRHLLRQAMGGISRLLMLADRGNCGRLRTPGQLRPG